MKSDIKNNGMWWSWIEYCDKCGKVIRTHSTLSSCKPDMEQADFCYDCIRHLIDDDIPYNEAKKQYMRSN